MSALLAMHLRRALQDKYLIHNHFFSRCQVAVLSLYSDLSIRKMSALLTILPLKALVYEYLLHSQFFLSTLSYVLSSIMTINYSINYSATNSPYMLPIFLIFSWCQAEVLNPFTLIYLLRIYLYSA